MARESGLDSTSEWRVIRSLSAREWNGVGTAVLGRIMGNHPTRYLPSKARTANAVAASCMKRICIESGSYRLFIETAAQEPNWRS